MNSIKKILFILLVLLSASSFIFSQTASEIVDRWDKARSYPSAKMEGVITVKDQFKTTKTSFINYSRGDVDTLIEFTSGQEKGQKILRSKSEIRLFYPDSDRTIILKGAQLRQSILGSDISYEDLTSIKKTEDDYEVTLVGEEEINGKPAWKIDLKGKVKGLAYPNQIVWIAKKDPVALKAQYFSSSNKLLKEMELLDYKVDKSYVIPTDILFKDVIKRNSETSMKIDSIDLEAPITDVTFSRINTSF